VKTSRPGRVLTTHTGSLPRSDELLELLLAKDQGRPYDEARFAHVVRERVDRAVRKQVETGIDIVNDGEQGKISFQTYRWKRLSGFERVGLERLPSPPQPAREALDFPEFYERWNRDYRPARGDGPPQVLACTGPIGWSDFGAVEADLALLAEATRDVAAEEVFMTAISPGTYAPVDLHYADETAYLDALADAMAREYEAIVAAGFLLQVDAPDLTTMYRLQDVTLEDYLRALELRVAAINRALARVPADRVRAHVCWGADEAPHHRDVPLTEIVGLLLQIRAGALVIPGANGRHAHEWQVWNHVSLRDEQVLVAGVIDSTSNIVEHPDAVAERIRRYAGVVGPERVIAGVDCGFGTVATVAQVDERVMWAKLASLVEGARRAET
jgi:5-methyltetrahydropteroyltriglutamate--homocysteine methyltransferase